MATKAEYTFAQAVAAAEGVRQSAKAAALATYGFVQANLAAYITALEAADNAYTASVNAALSALGSTTNTVPTLTPAFGGAPVPNNVTLGNLGLSGPLGGNSATLTSA